MYENNYPNNYHYESGNVYQSTQTPQGGDGSKQVQKKKKGSGAGKKILIAICCGLCFGIFGGLGFQAVDTATDILKSAVGFETKTEEDLKEEELIEEPAAEVLEEEQIAQVSNMDIVSTTVTDVTEVVQNVMPSVVSINNKYIEKTSFFGQEYSREAEGAGSGIIVGKNETELLLVSNYHVVEAAEELTVQFIDGSQVQAQIKGTDADKDLAVIAVQLDDIEAKTMGEIAIAKLGDSTALTVGEPVIAIGNALGYGQSVTTGVVSALNRPIYVEETSMDMFAAEGDREVNTFIQTDAAINPGNSGGALLNIRGEVIGINSNKIGGDAIEGMGYAIPISDAYPIIEDLMSKETRLKVDEDKKGYLGITGVNVYQEYAQIYGVPEGVYISSVMEGTGAEAAGLQIGDIIIALNDEEVSSMDELKDELAYYEEGAIVNLTIMRAGTLGYETIVVEITLGEQQTIE